MPSSRKVHLSRFHFDRVSAAVLRESPAAFRRRLLLERSAFELSRGASVTETAFAAALRGHGVDVSTDPIAWERGA